MLIIRFLGGIIGLIIATAFIYFLTGGIYPELRDSYFIIGGYTICFLCYRKEIKEGLE